MEGNGMNDDDPIPEGCRPPKDGLVLVLSVVAVVLMIGAAFCPEGHAAGFDVPDHRYKPAVRFDTSPPAPAPSSSGVGFDVKGAVIVLHYIKSGWKTPQLALAEFVLGPHIGGLYIGGAGLREVQGFGSVLPIASYVGQGVIPKLRFLRGITATYAIANQGVFAGKPAHLFGLGVSTK
jgi:hypothetical protein